MLLLISALLSAAAFIGSYFLEKFQFDAQYIILTKVGGYLMLAALVLFIIMYAAKIFRKK